MDTMSTHSFRMVDVSAVRPHEPEYWDPIVVPRAAIEAEVERLAALPRPANGRRSATIVHPQSRAPGLGFAPGIDVTINVLKAGEKTVPMRRNSNQVEICIGGTGSVLVGAETIAVEKWDVWNIPSMQVHSYRNDGQELMARLSYSNAPLLEKLECHFVEEDPPAIHVSPEERAVRAAAAASKTAFSRANAPNFEITDKGAWLRGYEYLVDIEVVENKALHWPWKLVEPYLPLRPGANQRTIWVLYNPATERRNGTTHSFFATIGGEAPNSPPRPDGPGHRHSSAAINYWFQGKGKSVVMGRTVEWDAGDLMLSGPPLAEHAHYRSPTGLACLTIQDHPLQIGMESLVWQEEMDGPILALGSEAGVTGFTGPRLRGAERHG